MTTKNKIGINFERKCGFVIATQVETTSMHGLVAACEAKTNSVNARSPLGDIYMKIGETTNAINEYMLTLTQSIKRESPYSCMAIYEKLLQIFQFTNCNQK